MMTFRLCPLILLIVVVGCQVNEPTSRYLATQAPPVSAEARQKVYRDTETVFQSGLLISPRKTSDQEGTIPVSMMPLVIRNCSAGEGLNSCSAGFGNLQASSKGRVLLDLKDPVVYGMSRSAGDEGEFIRELSFLWFVMEDASSTQIGFRGYRVWLGEDNRGLIWEVLDSGTSVRSFYVTEPLEAELRLEGKELHPGRRYAVEPSLEDHPDVVVARLMSEEPAPMGPFVYLGHSASRVTTLLCRCMETQVSELTGQTNYRWVKLNSWSDLPGGGAVLEKLALPELDGSWIEVLRLPERFTEKTARPE